MNLKKDTNKINQLFGTLSFAFGLLIIFFLLIPGIYIYFTYAIPAQKARENELAQKQAQWELVKDEVLAKEEEAKIENGIHKITGLIADTHYKLVIQNCTSCHSAKLITQNRAERTGWENMIRWMQAEQKLWDLGENEAKILDYLAKNYAPENKGRRPMLTDIDWYELE